jgi:predicted acyl esterase
VRRPAALALTLAVVGALSLVTAGPAQAADPVPTAHMYEVEDAGTPVTYDTDLYVPAGASPTDRRPMVLMTNGFGLSKSAAEVTSMSKYLSRHGYLVLAYTALGFGKSGGCIELQSYDHDAKATQAMVDQVLAGPAKDLVLSDAKGPVLGTVGGSYGGGGQLVLAALDKRIRAAVPSRTWNSLQYALDPNNLVVSGDPTGFDHQRVDQGVFKAQWTSLFFASGNANPAQGAGGCPEYKLATKDPVQVASIPTCPGYLVQLCTTYTEIAATGNASDTGRALLRRASAATFLDDVDIPVLLTQGQSDTLFNLNDALATYTGLRRRGVPVKMIWNSGGHGGYNSKPGECEVFGGGTTGLDDCYLTQRTLAFLDANLRGGSDPSPGFTYYRDWVAHTGTGSDDEQYGTAAAYPAMPQQTFTLSGTSALAAPGATAAAGSVTLLNPAGGEPAAYSETSNFSGPDSSPRNPAPPFEIPGQNASFTSRPFAAAVESVGVPRAHLRLTHANAGQDLVVFAKTYDVAPDGSAELIHRLIAPVRVTNAQLDRPVDLALAGFAHRFAKGHAVRLVLATTDATSRNNILPDVLTLATGPGSTFSLPARALPVARASTPASSPGSGSGGGSVGGSGSGGSSIGGTTLVAGRTLASTGLPPVLPLAGLAVLAAAVAVRRSRHARPSLR